MAEDGVGEEIRDEVVEIDDNGEEVNECCCCCFFLRGRDGGVLIGGSMAKVLESGKNGKVILRGVESWGEEGIQWLSFLPTREGSTDCIKFLTRAVSWLILRRFWELFEWPENILMKSMWNWSRKKHGDEKQIKHSIVGV